MSFAVDIIVIIAYFAIILGIGLSQRSKSGSVEGFALGDRQIAWWAVLASILAAETSAGTFFGTPGEGYALRNYTYAQLAIGTVFARLIVGLFFVPVFYTHNVVSIYEFLETRFGKPTRKMASATFLITRVLASGTRLWVPTILLVLLYPMITGEQPTPTQQFWLYAAALIFVTVLTVIYTASGGIRAVIWTDVIQVVVLFSALGFSIYYLLGAVGGWSGAEKFLTQMDDLKFINVGRPLHDDSLWAWIKNVLESEYTIWAAFLGSTFTTMATHGTDQDMVQRMLTAKNRSQSAYATVISGLLDFPIVFAALTIGILLYTYYQVNPDPMLPHDLKTGAIKGSQVFPYFILSVMPAGLRGLVLAGVLATTMGSLSTALNSLATSYMRDFNAAFNHEDATDSGRVVMLKKSTFIFATLLILVGLATAYVSAIHPEIRIIPIILGIFGYTYGSLLGIFLVGLFTSTRGNDLGNGIAMGVGFLVVMYLSGLDKEFMALFGGPGLPRPVWFPTLEFPWRIMFGTFATVIVALCFKTKSASSEGPRRRTRQKVRIAMP
jgi:solute:Na+ symporter, SSS family